MHIVEMIQRVIEFRGLSRNQLFQLLTVGPIFLYEAASLGM